MTADGLLHLVMELEYCIHCGSADEVRTVLRFFDEYGAIDDDLIRKIMEGEEPEDKWDGYCIVGKALYGRNSGITLYSMVGSRQELSYEEVMHIVEHGATPEWVIATNLAELLI